jgi:hypothetical protein
MMTSGWQRIGIVASVAWTVWCGGTFLAKQDAAITQETITRPVAKTLLDEDEDGCRRLLPDYEKAKACWNEVDNGLNHSRYYKIVIAPDLQTSVLEWLAALVSGWLAAWGALSLARWIARGFA